MDIQSLGTACCGCGACAAKCPVSAIRMLPDKAGFLYPSIDDTICVGCGRCDAVCPRLHPREADQLQSAYWSKSINADEILKSSSGGLFALLSHDVFDAGGIVVGASWSRDFSAVEHRIAGAEKDLDLLMRSKYVQSRISRDVYKEVKDAVSSGSRVLYSGTACQIAAIVSYLGDLANKDTFLSVEVACHGVPSPLLWAKWASAVEERYPGSCLADVNMRQKSTGWASYSVEYRFEKSCDGSVHTEVVPFNKDWYMKAFLANASLRPSCFNCTAKRSCGSDITLGDYWGISAVHPNVNFHNGVSLVSCNTQKGASAFSAIVDRLEYGATDFDKAVAYNPCLYTSASPYKEGDKFLDDLENGASITDLMKQYPFHRSIGQCIYEVLATIKRCVLRS